MSSVTLMRTMWLRVLSREELLCEVRLETDGTDIFRAVVVGSSGTCGADSSIWSMLLHLLRAPVARSRLDPVVGRDFKRRSWNRSIMAS